MRYTFAGLLVVGLALGIWFLWPSEEAVGPATTLPMTQESTTTTAPAETTTTSSVTTTPASHVVETVEEAEAILRELWFGWFEGIYNEDVDRIREVVATEEQVDEARSQFGVMEFIRSPEKADIFFVDPEILRSDSKCLAVWTVLVASGFREGQSQNVHVLRYSDDRWLHLGLWVNRNDLWHTDCDSLLP